MLINSEKLIGLKVETQNGTYLGRVQSFDIDIDAQGIRSYHIINQSALGRLFHSERFIVHHKQVVSINEEKMVVLDNVVKYKEENRVFAGAAAET